MNSIFSKIYNLLPSTKRRAGVILLGYIIIGTVFEVLGVGLLLPVIALLVDDNLASNYPIVKPVIVALGNPNHATQIQIIMVVLIGVYFFKNLYLAFLAWLQARFTVGLRVKLSQQLFAIYLNQPYTFHLQRNSAHLIRNISGQVSQFVEYGLNSTLNLIAEVLVLLSIVGLLLIIEPLGAIIVFLVLLTAAWGFHRSTRTRIVKWGKILQYHEGQRIQHLNQGLGGAKDIKLLGREADFLSQFHIHSGKSAQMSQFLEILNKLPRLWLELLAVIGLALLVLVMVSQGKEMSSIVPVAGLFAAAAFRLMPSVSRILSSAQSLSFGVAAINTLYDEFKLPVTEPKLSTKVTEPIIELQKEISLSDITYKYPDAPDSALNSVSIKILQGESVGFIGSSGSGKSTLVDVILGLLAPESGQVNVDGMDIQQNLRAWQDQIGYVPQSIFLTDDTFRRNIAFGLSSEKIDDEAVKRAINAAQLDELVSSMEDGMETIVGERGVRLSGGQRQRIGIARALYHDPNVLVLDEATSALDTATEEGVMQSVMALHGKKTIIIVAHRLSTVENCDKLYRLEQGAVVEEGIPSEIIPSTNISSSN